MSSEQVFPPTAPTADVLETPPAPVTISTSSKNNQLKNPVPQAAPGASAAIGHTIENSIPLSIFPIQADKFCICFCGLPGRGKTHVSRRLAR